MADPNGSLFDYDRLRKEITDPQPMSACISVFTRIDRERIAAETKERGPSFGVLELLNRLQNRGAKAIPQFITALKKCEYQDLYEELKAKAIARNMWNPEPANIGACDAKSTEESDSPVIARGITRSNVVPVFTSSITTTSGEAIIIGDSSYFSSNVPVVTDSACDTDTPTHLNHLQDKRTSGSDGPETRLKDIPLRLKSKIVSCLNVDSAMGNNWRGLAGEAGFTVEDEGKLRCSGDPMEELFSWMVQKHYCVSKLIEMLKKLERDDIINIIYENGFSEKPAIEQDIILQEANLFSSIQQPETDFKGSFDKKESQNRSQESSKNDDDEGQEEVLLSPLIDIPDDDVFLPDEITGKALFISVETYKHMTTLPKLNYHVNQLSCVFEYYGWQVVKTTGRDCLRMKETVRSYLDDVKKNDVCLVYLAGHTVQINGQNYLLASEVDNNSTAADIMECSLNINNLVDELTGRQALMMLLFVDGAHINEVEFGSPAALTGLAPMFPPPNTVIAFPCRPGYARPENARLLAYANAIKTILESQGQENITPTTLLAALRQEIPSSMVFSLSPRSLLPIYIHTTHEGRDVIAIRKPLSNTPRFAFIFCDDVDTSLKEHLENDAEHLEASLRQLEWQVNKLSRRQHQDIKQTVRDTLKDLEGDDMKIVMFYFLGFEAQDHYSLGVSDQPAQRMTISWLVNIMSEYICGPKVLIVDYSRPHVPQSLELVLPAPLPSEVLLSLPKEKKFENESPERDSFTLLLAQNLSAFQNKSLRDVIKSTASRKHHQVEGNLFYA